MPANQTRRDGARRDVLVAVTVAEQPVPRPARVPDWRRRAASPQNGCYLLEVKVGGIQKARDAGNLGTVPHMTS